MNSYWRRKLAKTSCFSPRLNSDNDTDAVTSDVRQLFCNMRCGNCKRSITDCRVSSCHNDRCSRRRLLHKLSSRLDSSSAIRWSVPAYEVRRSSAMLILEGPAARPAWNRSDLVYKQTMQVTSISCVKHFQLFQRLDVRVSIVILWTWDCSASEYYLAQMGLIQYPQSRRYTWTNIDWQGRRRATTGAFGKCCQTKQSIQSGVEQTERSESRVGSIRSCCSFSNTYFGSGSRAFKNIQRICA
jgi:hypothetical protein